MQDGSPEVTASSLVGSPSFGQISEGWNLGKGISKSRPITALEQLQRQVSKELKGSRCWSCWLRSTLSSAGAAQARRPGAEIPWTSHIHQHRSFGPGHKPVTTGDLAARTENLRPECQREPTGKFTQGPGDLCGSDAGWKSNDPPIRTLMGTANQHIGPCRHFPFVGQPTKDLAANSLVAVECSKMNRQGAFGAVCRGCPEVGPLEDCHGHVRKAANSAAQFVLTADFSGLALLSYHPDIEVLGGPSTSVLAVLTWRKKPQERTHLSLRTACQKLLLALTQAKKPRPERKAKWSTDSLTVDLSP